MAAMKTPAPTRSQPMHVAALVAAFATTTIATADFAISLHIADFGVTPVFNDVATFDFEVVMAGDLTPGQTYTEADVIGVDYSVIGILDEPTPSGFSSFALNRTMDGDEFRAQGSSLAFQIAADADVTDGLQFDELVGTDPDFGSTFLLNAREVDTGRYHPPIVQLNATGAGSLQNSNNFGGVNPVTGMKVDVDFGEEYLVDLSFAPADLTIGVAIPAECSADVNLSGAVDIVDLLSVLAEWGPCSDCREDIDGSGSVDFIDVVEVLAAWGPCV